MYKIVQAPDGVLSTPTKLIDFSGSKLQKIIGEMKETLLAQRDPEGVGLAANQVGLPYRLFLARFTTKKTEPIRVFVNPEIIEHSKELQPEKGDKHPLEGCLSIPKFYGVVKRYRWVKLKFQDENLKSQISNFEGFPAVVIQHEMDHLNGHLFMEKLLEQKAQIFRITGRDKKGKETWEEIELQ